MSRTAIACALCLLLAGCAAPTATHSTPMADADERATTAATGETTTPPTTTTTNVSAVETTENASATDSVDIAVRGGTLPVDHERAFARTAHLLGANVSAPGTVFVRSAAEIRDATGGVSTTGSGSSTRSFAGVMGIGKGDGSGDGSSGGGEEGEDENQSDVSVAAYTPSAHSVIVNDRVAGTSPEPALERTLAHEFVHAVQFRQNAFERLQRALDLRERYSRDRYQAYAGVVEGAAVFVGDAYDRRYLKGRWPTITAAEYRSLDSGVKLSVARYHFGVRYLDRRFDSPRNVSAAYDDPPRTTEELLHGGDGDVEPPADLSVSVAPGPDRRPGQRNVNGELFTRVALGTELNRTRASEAAAGWGADRLVPVVPEAEDEAADEIGKNETEENETEENAALNRSFVWATRWDSPAEADEFRAALGAYLDSRASRSDGLWRDDALAFRVVAVDSETVVLLAGEGSFVRTASVSGTNASVSVTAGEREKR